MHNLKIIVASTRPGRQGPVVAAWVNEVCIQYNSFNVELIDLAAVNLPFLNEPEHPKLQHNTQLHTVAWSKLIDPADGFIIVTCEYNFGYPASLKNALDFLYNEWNYKPVAFVSYGGIAGGTRAVQQLKQVVTAQKMMPIAESVAIPFFTKYIDASGKFLADEALDKSLNDMLAELLKWTTTLKSLRIK